MLAACSMQNAKYRIDGRGLGLFILGLARARDPDATTVRVLLVARDLGTHDREWSFFCGRSNGVCHVTPPS